MDLLDDAWNDAKTLTISVHLEKRDPAAKPEVIHKKMFFSMKQDSHQKASHAEETLKGKSLASLPLIGYSRSPSPPIRDYHQNKVHRQTACAL
jgi:hypothetical protein